MPLVAICTSVGALAIAGTPPLCIFDSEWMIFAGGFRTPHLALSILALLGSLLTVAYALWFVGRIFLGAQPEGMGVQRLPWTMVAPTVLLTVLALIEWLFPAPVFDWVDHALSLILGGHW
jgi:formate hydrogenlyase subunit 3/multisubunit Na+/H+ antiporter MnhD subunit